MSEEIVYEYPDYTAASPNGYQASLYFDLSPTGVGHYINGTFGYKEYTVYKEFSRQTNKMHSSTDYVPCLSCKQYSNGIIDTLYKFTEYYMDCALHSYVKKGNFLHILFGDIMIVFRYRFKKVDKLSIHIYIPIIGMYQIFMTHANTLKIFVMIL